MCWFSVEHSRQQVLQAETGERLAIRFMHGSSRWVIRENELSANNPRPVCLLDGTSVLFRPTEAQATASEIDSETEAVFRMLSQPRRDIFVWPDGHCVELNRLPQSLAFDVMAVPGSRQEPLITARDEQAVEELVSPEAATTAPEPIMASIRRLCGLAR